MRYFVHATFMLFGLTVLNVAASSQEPTPSAPQSMRHSSSKLPVSTAPDEQPLPVIEPGAGNGTLHRPLPQVKVPTLLNMAPSKTAD